MEYILRVQVHTLNSAYYQLFYSQIWLNIFSFIMLILLKTLPYASAGCSHTSVQVALVYKQGLATKDLLALNSRGGR